MEFKPKRKPATLGAEKGRRTSKLGAGLVVVFILGWAYAAAYAQEKSEAQELLTVWAGMLPIILSAPHGGREAIPGVAPRRGVGVAQFTTERDNNTAELAEKVAGLLERRFSAKPFLVIARFERKYLDANRPRAGAYEEGAAAPYYDAYHRALRAACEQVGRDWGGGILLDIHGQGAEPGMIFRGTDNGKSVSVLRQRFGTDALTGPRSILGWLVSRGYKVAPDAGEPRERRYTGGYTTRTYGSHRGTMIDAIQLELGSHLRARPNLDRTGTDLAEAIFVFANEYLPLARFKPKENAVAFP
jgi:N-formylglutamate amidohydrolase